VGLDIDSSLANLYFGKDDAESDISVGGLLEQGFLTTAAFQAAVTGKKSLIIGRKGSGKSAICVVLDRRSVQGNMHYSLVTPDEISSEEIRRFELPGITEAQAKTLLWSYVFDVQIAKFLLTAWRRNDEEGLPDSLRPIRKFLVDNNEVDDLRFSEKLWRIIERLKGSLSLEAFGVKLSGEVSAPSEGIRVSAEIDTIEQGLRDAYANTKWVGDKPSIILMVDQLERVWVNDRNSDHMVVGLLQASKHVSSRFDFATTVVFLRTDIYDFLQFQDRDKFRGDERRMDWSRKDLAQLLLARAKASLGKSISAQSLWTRIFPRTIDNESTKDFLINRTLLRPRDIIQFCNLCRDTAEKNGSSRILEADVLEATVQYSNWKLRDLIAEYLINYPFLNDLFVLFQNSSYVVTRPGLQNRLGTVRDALMKRYPDQVTAFEADAVLDVLYAIGFLGVLRQGEASYSFAGAAAVGPSDETFLVHPAFRDALRSTSSLDVRQPDLSRFSRRIESEASAIAGTPPVFRGSGSRRTTVFVVDRCQRIIEAFTASTLPPEVKAEVRSNLGKFLAVLDEVGSDQDFRDTFPGLLSELVNHLRSLKAAVRSSGLSDLNEALRLTRQLDDTIDQLVTVEYSDRLPGPGIVP